MEFRFQLLDKVKFKSDVKSRLFKIIDNVFKMSGRKRGFGNVELENVVKCQKVFKVIV